MIKNGYARLLKNGTEKFFSFQELSLLDDISYANLRQEILCGNASLSCACSETENLPLILTKNHVVRVAENKQQEKHAPACPKSIHYEKWLKENMPGTLSVDENGYLFKISLPGIEKSIHSSAGTSSGETKEHRLKLECLVSSLNAIAWEKQTYSIRKALSLSKREGRKGEVSYKNAQDFRRLMFGVSHEIHVMTGQEVVSFYDLCYKPSVYYANIDYKQRFFIYATVLTIHAIKEERAYQYITLSMPSKNSRTKCSVRVPTERFHAIFDPYQEWEDTPLMLAGYVHRCLFSNANGEIESDWMTLLNGMLFPVSKNGLLVKSSYAAQLADYFCAHGLIFKKPYLPIPECKNDLVDFVIEQREDKDIFIDIMTPEHTRFYSKRKKLFFNHPSYEYLLIKEGTDLSEVWKLLQSYLPYLQ